MQTQSNTGSNGASDAEYSPTEQDKRGNNRVRGKTKVMEVVGTATLLIYLLTELILHFIDD